MVPTRPRATCSTCSACPIRLASAAPNYIVWGNSAGWRSSYYIVWGNAIETADGEYIVWGSGDYGEYIVWGNGIPPDGIGGR